MSFDRVYKNRKDRRKSYRGSKSFDRSCRNHKRCSYCKNTRTFKNVKKLAVAEDEIKTYKEGFLGMLRDVEIANIKAREKEEVRRMEKREVDFIYHLLTIPSMPTNPASSIGKASNNTTAKSKNSTS